MSEGKYCLASCNHCGQHIEFPAQGVGMRVACPQCARETILVEDLALASGRVEEISAAELKAALGGTVARHRVSLFYQAGLLLVAIFMLFLPLAYLAFASFGGYCIYWYADHARVLFSNPSGGVYVLILNSRSASLQAFTNKPA
jgi:hypothetical protein